MIGGNDVTFPCQLKCPFSVYDSRGVRQFQFGSFDWCAPSGSLTSTNPGEFDGSVFGSFEWCAPSGSSTSTTPGEFDSSSLEVLTGAPPRGVQKYNEISH